MERENFILNTMKLAEEMEIKFAYPTQTLHIAGKDLSDKKDLSEPKT